MNIRAHLSEIKSAIHSPSLFNIYRKYRSFTMFDQNAYIENLRLAEKVNVPGCVVECGTWRGGMIAGWASILGDEREYYLFDSFEGLPAATEKDGQAAIDYQVKTKEDPTYGWDNCRAEMSFAKQAMDKSGVKNCHLVKGWFDQTVPQFDKLKKIALLHLDGDWYDSIMVCLENLYDSVTAGGIVVIDDYTNWDGCSRAVHDFFSKYNLSEHLQQSNNYITFFKKNSSRS